MEHKLPELAYHYDALEPYMEGKVVKIHHTMHHQAYVDGLNKAEKQLDEALEKGDFQLIKHLEKEIAFHGSGHILHSLFWENMAQPATRKPLPGNELEKQLQKDFGSYQAFKNYFNAAAAAVEGSGWAILGWNPMFNKMVILQVEKHQNLTQWGIVPLLVLDVWEHAYYLQYENRRAEFISKWWNVVNWDEVEKRFANCR